MRILMVVRPAVGGMREQMLALSHGLRDKGHDVEIAGPSDALQEAEADGFEVHAIPIVGPLDPVHDARAAAALARVMRSGRFDLVHAHGFKAGLIARVSAALAGVPAVVTVHNHVLYRTDISAATKWRYITVERLLASRSAAYITVSDALRDELVHAYHIPERKVVTVHNGIDPSAFLGDPDVRACRDAFSLPLDRPVLGTACRFAPQKGLDDLIATLPEILERVPGAVFALGGDGPLAEQLKAQAEEEGIEGSIVWLGTVHRMPEFLRALDAYVSSSLSEGLPLSLVEAAAAGVPVAATSVGGTPEVIADGETGLLVPPGDHHALADACVCLLEDHERAEAFAAAGRVRALAEFTPQAMVERTLRVYEKVLA